MTDLSTIRRVISDDDRFEIIEANDENKDTAVFFYPKAAMLDVFALEKKVRTLFSKIPEKTSIISTHGGIVMMTCSEHSSDVRVPPRSINVQCFLNEAAAREEFKLSLR
jgi:hypothetical protein